MSHSDIARDHEGEEELSLPLFALTIAATLVGIGFILKFTAPRAVWHAQVSAGLWKYGVVILAISVFNCFVEFFFHRYVLHKPVVPFLSRFYRQHTKHHSLTRIGRRRTPEGREVPFVENIYPITQPEQKEASFFPWYSLAVFALVVTPLLVLCQWLMPSFPWFFSGYAALAMSLTLYEVFHAIEHWSFEKWAPLIEHRRLGWFWRKVYSFHLRHHAVIDCNEAISGFFTIPLADWAFGTCIIPKTLYMDGSEWESSEFQSPRPCAFIRWCDEKSDALVKERRLRAQAGQPAESKAAVYTRGEEIAHCLTHGLGLLLSIAALTLLVVFASLRGNAWHIVSFTVFGVTLFLLYAASTLYHSVRAAHWKDFFLKLDYATAFLLVAGTYTPFLLVSLRGPWGWTLFGIIWGLCAIGVCVQFLFPNRFRVASLVAYLSVGWLLIVAVKPLLAAVPEGAIWLLLAGALCYTVGAIFYLWKRLRYHHAVWHAFVLGGSACHFFAVLLFLLPSRA
ncbi:MAG TPA: hemolysin III family protein [Opitutaceae bacterium]|nr:hemolysin III family protein [Opitutaceae bacterium]